MRKSRGAGVNQLALLGLTKRSPLEMKYSTTMGLKATKSVSYKGLLFTNST